LIENTAQQQSAITNKDIRRLSFIPSLAELGLDRVRYNLEEGNGKSHRRIAGHFALINASCRAAL
jgi:hypothetical protein